MAAKPVSYSCLQTYSAIKYVKTVLNEMSLRVNRRARCFHQNNSPIS